MIDVNFFIGFWCLSFQYHFYSIENCLMFDEAFVMSTVMKWKESKNPDNHFAIDL